MGFEVKQHTNGDRYLQRQKQYMEDNMKNFTKLMEESKSDADHAGPKSLALVRPDSFGNKSTKTLQSPRRSSKLYGANIPRAAHFSNYAARNQDEPSDAY